MVYQGEVRNGVVVLDDPSSLPDGTKVNIEPADMHRRTLAERFRNVVAVVTDLPSDMAENHDHYTHGTPKT